MYQLAVLFVKITNHNFQIPLTLRRILLFRTNHNIRHPMRYILIISMLSVLSSVMSAQPFLYLDCEAGPNVPNFYIQDQSVSEGQQNVCLSLQVDDFNNVASFNFILSWDASVIEYQSLVDNGALTQPIFVNDVDADNGLIFIVWAQFNQSESLSDESSILELCFDVIGLPGEEVDFQIIGGFNIPSPQVQYGIDDNIPNDDGCTFDYPNHVSGTVDILCDVLFAQLSQCHTTSNTGSITIDPCGGTPPYSYTILPSGLTGTIPADGESIDIGLSPDIYTVTVMDAAGDIYTESVEIENKAPLTIQENIIMPPSCEAFANGIIEIEGIGGESFGIFGYEYEWSNGQYTEELERLPSDLYTVTVSDINGCSVTDSYDLTVPEIVIDTFVTPDICGVGQGVLGFSISGGTPFADGTYEVSIFNVPFVGQTNAETLVDLDAGSYTIDVDDAEGCSAQVDVIIRGEAIDYTFTPAQTDISCFGDSDGNFSIEIDDPGPFTFDPITHATLADASFLVTNNSISTTISATDLGPGTWTISATNDLNSCPFQTEILIFEPAELTLTTGMVFPNTSCDSPNGEIFLTAGGGAGGYMYTWNPDVNNSNTFIEAEAIQYSVTVTDRNLCSATTQVMGTESIFVGQADIEVIDGLDCNMSTQGLLEVDVIGDDLFNYSIEWIDSNTNTSLGASSSISVGAGTYEVVITHLLTGCDARDDITLGPGNDLTYEVRTKNLRCFEGADGVVEIFNITGGSGTYSVDWVGYDTDALILENANAGLVEFILMDDLGCSVLGSVTLTQPNRIILDVGMPFEAPTCFGELDGVYTAVVTSGGTTTNGFSFDWPGDAFDESGVTQSTASGFGAGEYFVVVQDELGCSDTLRFRFDEPDQIVINENLSAISTPECVGTCDGIVDLRFSGGTPSSPPFLPYTVMWEDGNMSQQRTGLCPELYTITVTDDSGCEQEIALDFTLPGDTLMILVDSLMTSPLSCGGDADGEIVVFATGGVGSSSNFSFDWTDNVSTTTIAENLAVGDYEITVTDEAGCTASTSYQVDAGAPLVLDLFDSPIVPCAGDSICFLPGVVSGGNGPPYFYQIQNQSPVLPIDSCIVLFAGIWDIQVRDSGGCKIEDQIQVIEPSITQVDIGDDLVVELGDTDLIIEADYFSDYPLDSVSWSTIDEINCLGTECQDINIGLSQDQVVFATAYDINGCVSVDQIFVTVDEIRNVFLPTVFMPNNEEERIFMVHLGQGAEIINYLAIYDRWGNEMYRLEDIPNDETSMYGWTGRYGNLDASEGVYVYIVDVSFSDGETRRFTRDLTLLR